MLKNMLILFLILLASISSSVLFAGTTSEGIRINDAITSGDTIYIASEEHGIIYSNSHIDYSRYTLEPNYNSPPPSIDKEPNWHESDDWGAYNTGNSNLLSNKILKVTNYEYDDKYIYFLSENGLGYISDGKIYNIDTSDKSIFTSGWVDKVDAISSARPFFSVSSSYLFIAIDNEIYIYYHGGGWEPEWRHHPGNFPESMDINTIYAYKNSTPYNNIITLLIGSNLGLIKTEEPSMGDTSVTLHNNLIGTYMRDPLNNLEYSSYKDVNSIFQYNGRIYIGTDIGALAFNDNYFDEELHFIKGLSQKYTDYYYTFTDPRYPGMFFVTKKVYQYYSNYSIIAPYKDKKGVEHLLFTVKPMNMLDNKLSTEIFQIFSRDLYAPSYAFLRFQIRELSFLPTKFPIKINSNNIPSNINDNNFPKIVALLPAEDSTMLYIIKENGVRIIKDLNTNDLVSYN